MSHESNVRYTSELTDGLARPLFRGCNCFRCVLSRRSNGYSPQINIILRSTRLDEHTGSLSVASLASCHCRRMILRESGRDRSFPSMACHE